MAGNNHAVLNALASVRGFLVGLARLPGMRSLVVEQLRQLDPVIGSLLPKSMMHDAGAYARCSYCNRYSASPAAISSVAREICDCGSDNGWSGSFKPPGADAQWSLGFRLTPRAPAGPAEQGKGGDGGE